MVDIFAEVDDDLRAERARVALRRYGAVAIVVVVVAILAVGIWQALVWRQHRRDARLSGAYFAVQRQADQQSPGAEAASRPAAIAGFAPLIDAPSAGIRSLARLRDAQFLADAGRSKDALAMLDRVAADRAAGPLFADLATLLAVDRQIDQGDPARLQARLATIEGPGAPYRGLAIEAGAMIDLSHGQVDKCRQTLRALLADGSVPQGVRERASTLLQALGAGAAG